MDTSDLMGGYTAYVTPNAVLQELATTGATQTPPTASITITLSVTVSLSFVAPQPQ
ncbi:MULTISPECIES: hypothetical protein [unclassified Streptomyces]|uniref:hypothetical protein n=1 Tax=unclassified Streptomyces TaxID=2593676 RepID=UPI002E2E39D4|nr:hypothetical protein [Streptomyces sp. NBC_00223]